MLRVRVFVFIASNNLLKPDNRFFDKKINLGLDLQGGSYLLLEIDNSPVIEQKIQNISTLIRTYFKEKGIRIGNLNLTNNKIRFSVNEEFKQKVIDEFQNETLTLKSNRAVIFESGSIHFIDNVEIKTVSGISHEIDTELLILREG